MAKQVQLRRGTTAELSSVTGAAGEVIVDTTKDTLTVHDAYTAGGTPLLREDLGNLADQSIAINKIVKGSASQVLKTDATGTGLEWGSPSITTSDLMQYSGAIVKTNYYKWETKVSIPKGSTGTIWSVTVPKLYDSSVSDLLVFMLIPGHGTYSDWCGIYSHISGSTTTSTDGTAYRGINYISGNDVNEPVLIHMNGKRFESLNAGNHTLTIGWSARDGGTGNAPANNAFNPDSANDVRNHQNGSVMTVFEILR